MLDDYVNCLIVASFWWRHRDIWSTGAFRLSSWNPSRSFRAGTKTSEHACNLNIFIPFHFHSVHVGEIKLQLQFVSCNIQSNFWFVKCDLIFTQCRQSASKIEQILAIPEMCCILMFQQPEADRNPLDHDELWWNPRLGFNKEFLFFMFYKGDVTNFNIDIFF